MQYAEIGDGRCFLSLMGVTRFRIAEEPTTQPYRTASADYAPFAQDFVEGAGEGEVDRDALLKALRDSPRPTTSRSTGRTFARPRTRRWSIRWRS